MSMRTNVLVGALLILTLLNFIGACFIHMSVLSKQEYIDHAVAFVMQGGGYQTTADFYQAFPECCEVFYWTDVNRWNFLDAFFGNSSPIVKIEWSYTDRLGNYSKNEVDFVVVSKCGDVSMTTATGD